MKDLEKMVTGVMTLMELGGIALITGIALKRNKECYNAECELINEVYEHNLTKIDMIGKDVEIHKLKREVAELKEKYEVEDEDA